MLNSLINGLTTLINAQGVAYIVAGSLIGVFLGVIPGLGGSVILSIVLAFINHISLEGTLSMFLAVQAASYFSASVTSILLNTPAHPEAFAVTFDGFPMAQRGEAGRALGLSAASTCVGGLIGCAVLVGFIQVANQLPLIFHPPEYVALIIIAMLLVGTLGTDAISKAIASAGLGLIVASIGTSAVTGAVRYTFNSVSLESGISLVALVLGLFAIPQMVLVFGTATTVARQDMTGRELSATAPVALERGLARQVVGGIAETFAHWFVLLRSALIGAVTGIVPGIGGFAANFLSYGIAQQTSKKRSQYGTGIPEGIIAPEGSSLSKEAGGLIPLIALGIPGGVGAALLLAALNIKGIRTGPGFTHAYPTLAYEMVWIVALGGLIGTLAGVLAAPLLARVTRVPGPCLVPFIMAMTVIGVFAAEVEFFAVMETVVFAIFGLALRRLRYSVAAFAVGLVLGPTLEDNIYLTHTLYPGFSFVRTRPLADGLFVLAALILLGKAFQIHHEAVARRRELVQARTERIDAEGDTAADLAALAPYPLLGLIVSASIVAFCVPFVIYGMTHYSFSTVLMPAAAGIIAAAAAAARLPFDIANYVRYRRLKGRIAREGRAIVSAAEPAVELIEEPMPALVGALSPQIAGEAESAAVLTIASKGENKAPSRDGLAPIVEKQWGWHGQYTREVVAFLWFGSLVALCYLFGFKIGVPVFCFVYGITATRRVFSTWFGRILFAVGTAVVMGAAAHYIFGALHVLDTPVFQL